MYKGQTSVAKADPASLESANTPPELGARSLEPPSSETPMEAFGRTLNTV